MLHAITNDAVGLPWRGFDRPGLDAAYNNGVAVNNSESLLSAWQARSAALKGRHTDYKELIYGPRPRNRIDLFPCGRKNAPLFVFIHGGYWQRNSKDIFSFVAEGLLNEGVDVALPGYTLCPDITLSGIVDEVNAALDFLLAHYVSSRGRGPKLVISGWSAGAHLTAFMMARSDVHAGLAISGVYDVEPCRLNYLNKALRLSASDARALSPLHQMPDAGQRLSLVYGEDELPELQRQSREYFETRAVHGLDTRIQAMTGRNHYTILEDLAAPEGYLKHMAMLLLTF